MIKDNKTVQLKAKFLEYFRELPVQKLAGACIARDEDTVSRWKKDDAEFAEMIERARAEWVLKRVNKVKSSEWLLERVTKEYFSPRNEVVGDGKQLPVFQVINYADAIKKEENTRT